MFVTNISRSNPLTEVTGKTSFNPVGKRTGACGKVAIKALFYKPEGRRFDTL
jgi:hypothetical protein